MTPQDVITEARPILNDPNGITYTDTELLAHVNAGIKEVSRIAPQYFYKTGLVTCVAGALQAISFADAQALLKVMRVVNGDVVHETDVQTLDLFDASWRAASSGAAKNWARDANDPLRFFVNPPSDNVQQLEILYVSIPPTYALGGTISLPDSFAPALADYVVYRAESRDDQHVNSNRAVAFFNSFVAKVKG